MNLPGTNFRKYRRSSALPARRTRLQGFTLLELMIGVAVLGLIASIAVPAYSKFVLKGQIAAAVSDIGQIEVAISRYQEANFGGPPPDLATINQDGRLDPWGRSYYYLSFTGLKGKGAMRKDKSLVPINTDYDLYSAGPDGQTVGPLTAKASQDDIVRANDGAFIGVAADY